MYLIGSKPVVYVSWYDGIRFANWLNSGDTETGAYTITAQAIADNSITRNPGTAIVLASEDEWYKAAYYSASSMSYFAFPTGFNVVTICTAPTGSTNSANCDAPGTNAIDGDIDGLTTVTSYTGSASPYGTFDQGGNVEEWNDANMLPNHYNRVVRGGAFFETRTTSLEQAGDMPPTAEFGSLGFRLAMIPEPGAGVLVIAGLLGLGGWRRVRD